MPELNFDGHNTLYASHGLHAFAAKCPPQLVRYGIKYYSRPGDTVLDPMAGSGTTLVEAKLLGRRAIGYDIDPLAKLIAEVKSRPLKDSAIERGYISVLQRVKKDLLLWKAGTISTALKRRAMPPDFKNRDYWFSAEVATALTLLSHHLSTTHMSSTVRKFLWVAFSSTILAKTSVANARDIIHSRHHYYGHPTVPDVVARFASRVQIMRRQMKDFYECCRKAKSQKVTVRRGDARRLGMNDETVDLIFTSPPYATALDYPRAHFLAIPWMGDVFNLTVERYLARAPLYVGTERGRFKVPRSGSLEGYQRVSNVINTLEKDAPRHAKLTRRYFSDMQKVLFEMARVLRPNKHAIMVVCPSHIRKIAIPTHEVLAELAGGVGLRLKRQHSRTISERRRLLPYVQQSFGKRMDTEYVLIFQKK